MFQVKNIDKKLFIVFAIFCLIIILFSCKYNGKNILKYVKWKDKIYKVENSEDKYIKKEFSDIDLRNENEEYHLSKIELKNKKLIIYINGIAKWYSPDEYNVQDFLYCDIDRDNEDEIVVLLWKKGKFGTRKPFFLEDDKEKWSQHIFIYDDKNGFIKPIWCSSYISVEIKEMAFDDTYKILTALDTDNCRTRWAWITWGLNNLEASKYDYDDRYDKILKEVKINSFGDNLIHKEIYDIALKNNKNFDFIYENIKDELKTADINSINQETIFVDKEEEYSTYPYFGTPIECGKSIVDAGFNLVTLANNHSLDKYEYGINTTIDFYESYWKNKVNYLGIKKQKYEISSISQIFTLDKKEKQNIFDNRYKIIKVNGFKIAVFNYTYNLNKLPDIRYNKYNIWVNSLEDEKRVKRELDEGRRKSDVCIVFVHWGSEYKNEIDSFQKKWSKIFLEKGVDIVIGTHPHVLQDVEVLKDSYGREMLVYYSLGNFISYQGKKDTDIGGEAKVDIVLTNHGLKIKSYKLNTVKTFIGKNIITAKIIE